jgi:hypothetical protein
MAVGTRMQQRRATEAVWVTSEYVLAAGELGVTIDTGILKIGDGSNTWTNLPIAFESQYLSILGTAANSELLEGISAESFAKMADVTEAATASKIPIRTSSGNLIAATATNASHLVTKGQMDAEATKFIVGRTVTAATELQLADQHTMIFVNHSSLTAQVVVTIPANATVAFPVGSWLDVMAIGSGGVKLTPAAGVTLSGRSNVYGNFGVIRLVKSDTNQWFGIPMQNGTRLPKIRVIRNTGTTYTAGGPSCIPWNVVDSADTYNPDDEWFSIPGTGLPTARRIIVNKDGEYLINCDFLTTAGTAQGALIVAKMVNDNTLTGATYFCNIAMTSTDQATVRTRLSAGDSVGAAYEPPTAGISDLADGSFGNRNHFKIARLSD